MNLYWSSIAVPVLIDTIAVLGLYLIVSGGRLSIGHAAFFGIGAYTTAVLCTQFGVSSWLSIAAAVAVTGAAGALFAAIAERLGHWFFAIATLAFAIMLAGMLSSLDSLGGATGLYGVPLDVDLRVVLCALAAVLALIIVIDRSAFGRALRAVRNSELAAQALGIDPAAAHVCAFALGSAIAGLAGALWAHYLGMVKPDDLSLDHSLFFLVYLAVGGIEFWGGALLGTLVLGFLPEVLRFSHEYRLAFFGLLLTTVMVLRPSGLLPRNAFKFLRRVPRDSARPAPTPIDHSV